MAELRPHLAKDSFLELIRMMEGEGYCLAYIKDDAAVVAVAGYRIHTTLFMGKNLYVDDLVTADRARSMGHGKALIDWLRDQAVEEGCNSCISIPAHKGTARIDFICGRGSISQAFTSARSSEARQCRFL